MQNLEQKLQTIFDNAYESVSTGYANSKQVVKNSYAKAKKITKIVLLSSGIGLVISYIMLIFGIFTSSPFVVFLSALLATVVFFALWKAPMIVSNIIYGTIGQLPIVGKPTRAIYNLVTPLFLTMLNLSFIASFISVMVLIFGLETLTFKGYCILIAVSLFFFILSEFSYSRVVVWRNVLAGLVVVFLAAHIFMQVYPNTLKEFSDDATDDYKEVVIKKGSTMYKMEKDRLVATDTAKENLMSRILDYHQDSKTKDKIYHVIYSTDKVSFINGREVYVPSQSLLPGTLSEEVNSKESKEKVDSKKIKTYQPAFSTTGTKEVVHFNQYGPPKPTTKIYLAAGQRVRVRSTQPCLIGSTKYPVAANEWTGLIQTVDGHLDIEGNGTSGKIEIEVL